MKKGLVHIYTGDGKGKTTAAMGLAFRAAGHGKQVYILQFMKGWPTGEKVIADGIIFITYQRANQVTKFINQMTEAEKLKLKKETKKAWQTLWKEIKESDNEVFILDEVMAAISNDLLTVEEVAQLIKEKPETIELVLTGRDAPQALIDLADYVTEMKAIKHPLNKNISARKGIEF